MKKLIMSGIVSLIILAISVPAFADTALFDFTLNPGQSGYSSFVHKADSEQRAYVSITSSNFINSDKTWFRVRDSADNIKTETKWANANISFTLNYISTGYAGDYYRLKGQQDSASPYYVHVAGRWTP
ncbi:hypothetical protein CPAST_c25010 [Clostridium pasteurianum DSM 525 = ATCC 6013]|uniref:Uncharacterized protein n=1 Tax=Clostridium pasteurianum DSM 525 = ATCC 6013 TaxID=1262449 RepID=A0A0H3JAH7_CLOPA|nr:hypothetical protein [Clostridium pasteurianum]AJA48570.1 hypothetical protein CPAST_c25010 [Clostridium pasteurianum DSM 525 = ATCC 6013]AJA52558.1 hypothetical protein CLPA_c25010 [Clostridium pasteurianum DSM 525 = ATCC 6013]AOZ75802.1 hypothetical protein AQ983_12150 [Clostridium pasteurianum DSM 525 = ATCC 6013]AOZ79598.1 hypothetical protein AQ984_12145 [Clostridium pasteurianum]ELP57951.1 hypothetical protein F502_17160 [Clostridium pasteurianum DSM 525 = ATCC 6013]